MITGYRLYKGAWIFERDPHTEKKLTSEDIKSLLAKGGLMIRNAYDFDCGQETSFWYVIKDSFGGMEELSSKMRNQVKKCFKTMSVEKISAEELKEKGYPVFVEASESYKVKSVPPSKEEFLSRINNAEENEFWGCYDIETDKLVAFSMNCVSDESCEYRTMKAIPAFQKLYAYYGLIYEMNRYYLEERGLKYVNDGGRSITNHSNIQPFLIEKFNFKKAYCHFDIYYKWWLKLAVKTLYPFRKLIKVPQVQFLLNMEAMAHNEI
jgi:hypothetical protein